MNTDQRIFKIPSDNLGTLNEKFKKLGRRAKKLGLPVPTFTELKVERITERDEIILLPKRVYLVHHIAVDAGCSEVKVSGWTFVATIQHTPEGNIVRKVGSNEVPPQYRNVDPFCDHCQLVRNRKDTYLVQHEDGSYKLVGRNCLQDFLGTDALHFAERAQYLTDIDSLGESLEGGSGASSTYEPLEIYLAYVAEVIKLQGWMSKTRARQLNEASGGMTVAFATADVAYKHLHPPSTDSNFKPLFKFPSDESNQVALKAIEWASEIEGEDIAEYLHNIRIIARRCVYEGRDMGMAASIIASYQRHLADLKYKELQAHLAETSKHVGNVGDQIRIKVMVHKVVPIDSMYGLSHLHVMFDQDGNCFIWFSSSGSFETGQEIVLDAKIKKHDERNGIKQTVLARCSEVILKVFLAIVDGKTYEFTAASQDEVKKLVKEKLGLKRLPRGTVIFEASE